MNWEENQLDGFILKMVNMMISNYHRSEKNTLKIPIDDSYVYI